MVAWVSDQNLLKGLIQGYFVGLFSRDENCDPNLVPKGGFPRISEEVWNDIN